MEALELPKRPVGTRRSWKRWSLDRAMIGERLRETCFFAKAEWGDPIEAFEFTDRQKRTRRIEALYSNGKHISIRIRKDGSRTDSLKVLS